MTYFKHCVTERLYELDVVHLGFVARRSEERAIKVSSGVCIVNEHIYSPCNLMFCSIDDLL